MYIEKKYFGGIIKEKKNEGGQFTEIGSLEASKFGVSSITAGLSLLSTCNASTDL